MALLIGIAAVAGSYLAAGYTRQFVVAPVDQLIVNVTPGVIVTYMIENVGEEAHLIHIGMAFLTMIAVFAGLALAGMRLSHRFDDPFIGALAAGGVGWLLAVAVTKEPLLALGPAIPTGILTGAATLRFRTRDPDASRRRALGTIAGGVAFVGFSFGVGRWFHKPDPAEPIDNKEEVDDLITEAEENNSLDIASTHLKGIVSDRSEFYNVDIAEFKPEIDADDWELTFTGDVGEELTIDFDDLEARESENRFITLRCVGEDLNGHKLDTAVWTGIPIAEFIEEIDPEGNCDCAMLHGDDGYYVQFPIEVLETGFLAWGMNGVELPTEHGHPVRVLTPGHWGETNVKWLTEIEVLDTEEDGYWEERGWEGTGEVNTVAKLWDDDEYSGITELDDGRIELAGHAYAGTRGISRVEVSIDGGSTWTDADLSEPLPDEDVWRLWRHRFEPSGTHEVLVRATDGDGQLQTETDSSSSPSGATGWVTQTVN
jgi:DMSO/TMAO reductase YedYZ molybdopterin-dependent catalytic subunit